MLQEYEVASDTEKREAPCHDGLGAGAAKGEMTASSSGLHLAVPGSSGAVCRATLENTRAFPAHCNSQRVSPAERNIEQPATRAPQARSAARGPSRAAEHASAAFCGPASTQLLYSWSDTNVIIV